MFHRMAFFNTALMYVGRRYILLCITYCVLSYYYIAAEEPRKILNT